MCKSPLQVTVFAAILAMGFSTAPTAAQQLPQRPEPEGIEKEALEAFHGEDLKGKDGPLSKAGMELLTLYYRHERAGGDATADSLTDGLAIRLKGDMLVVDAIAREGHTERLLSQFSNLGATELASQGPVVSGLLPIEKIPEAAKADALQSLRSAVAQTGGEKTSGPRSVPDPKASQQDSPSPSDSSPDSTSKEGTAGPSEATSLWWYLGGGSLILALIYGAAALFRR